MLGQLLVEIKDPLNVNNKKTDTPLLAGAQISARIQGKILKNVFAIPKSNIIDNNYVYVASNGTLKQKTVAIIWQRKNIAFAKGLLPGELIVTTPLYLPTEGMKIEIESGNNS